GWRPPPGRVPSGPAPLKGSFPHGNRCCPHATVSTAPASRLSFLARPLAPWSYEPPDIRIKKAHWRRRRRNVRPRGYICDMTITSELHPDTPFSLGAAAAFGFGPYDGRPRGG